MIQTKNLRKEFDTFCALEDVSCTIEEGCIYGMVGSNGAGKSTFLRLLAGIYQPTSGSVEFDGQNVFENPAIKRTIAYVPDDLYFLSGATMNRMADFYQNVYPDFDAALFQKLEKQLDLNPRKALDAFSKGMHRQAAVLLAIARHPKYLLFDETFDGLDPVMRTVVKQMICDAVLERGCSVILTSHSLRELEDICDQLALLHKGGLVLESDIQQLKTTQFKVQIAFDHPYDRSQFSGISISHFEQFGSVSNLIIKGDQQETMERLRAMSPILLDLLPLTLEEVFTYEMETLGYTFDLAKGGLSK